MGNIPQPLNERDISSNITNLTYGDIAETTNQTICPITQENFINSEFLQNEKFKKLLFNSSKASSEFLSIQEGCDKFCSFCVVPYTRGPEYSRLSLIHISEPTRPERIGVAVVWL